MLVKLGITLAALTLMHAPLPGAAFLPLHVAKTRQQSLQEYRPGNGNPKLFASTAASPGVVGRSQDRSKEAARAGTDDTLARLKTLKVDTSSPVMVTGATGYVAGVIIKYLLELGVTIHAPVRNASNKSRLQYLLDLADKAPGSIKFFEGDLLKEGSYAEAMKGCSIVFHAASPFKFDIQDPQIDLVDPAEKGTKNVLTQATKTDSVKKVILTSSTAAVYDNASDKDSAPNKVLDEVVWNTGSTLDYQPYALSKTRAERVAWEIAGGQTGWSMVVLNPSMIMGPGVKYHESSESYILSKNLGGEKSWTFGWPDFTLGVVDVREVAYAHIVAAYSDSAKGRHILSGTNTSFMEMANIMKKRYPEYNTIPFTVPKGLAWLLGPIMGWNRKFVENNVNVPMTLDNTKSQKELGVRYRPLADTMSDMFDQLIEMGKAPKRK